MRINDLRTGNSRTPLVVRALHQRMHYVRGVVARPFGVLSRTVLAGITRITSAPMLPAGIYDPSINVAIREGAESRLMSQIECIHGLRQALIARSKPVVESEAPLLAGEIKHHGLEADHQLIARSAVALPVVAQ
jgi:hypothetical protein